MKNVLSIDRVRRAEALTERRGVDMMFLRLNAGLAVAERVKERVTRSDIITAVFCGSGGNGFDGVLAAARLKRLGCEVRVYIVGDFESTLKKLGSAVAYAKSDGVPIYPASAYCGKEKIIVDAIFGIGLNREISGDVKDIIEALNAARGVFSLSVDIPSGLNGDSGDVMGIAFRADETVTFSCYKRGMLFGNGREYCGRIVVADVGVETESDMRVYEDCDFSAYRRSRIAHKGNSGRIYIIGGCGEMVGAPLIAAAAAHAAYLNGAGAVVCCVPSVQRVALASRMTMAMMRYLRDTPDGFISFDKQALDDIMRRASSICIGIGMGKTPELKRIVGYLCKNFSGSIVVDADALNSLGGDISPISGGKAKVVVTPHVGEFVRLTGAEPTPENAMKLARDIGGVVALKSSTTIITDGREVRINITGTPAMAKGGVGDLLGGCISALMCSYSPIDAATVACYRNGMGAERAVSSYAEMMLSLGDILDYADYPELLK